MYPRCAQYTLLAALVPIARAIMVETVDGDFVPWNLVQRAPGDSGVAVRLKNNNDTSYLATVMMGTPEQEIQMAASLSQNFISVASAPSGGNDSTYYNPSTSTSYMPRTETATVQSISGGPITGRFGGETCVLKSATSSVNFAYNASVLLTDALVMSDLYPPGARGVLGYGVGAPTSAPDGASLLNKFLPANFTTATCGIELNHMDDPVPDGILTMGAVDTNAFTGDFTNVVVPKTSQISWAVPFDNLTFPANGSPQTLQGLVASIDPYHTGIRLPTEMANQIYSGISGSQPITGTVYSVPCTSKFQLTLTFGGRPFTISERDTLVKQPNGTCHGAVMGGAQDVAQVGAPFLRNVYTQFGAQKAGDGSVTFSVGFATKNLRNSSTTSTTPAGPTSTRSGTPRVMGHTVELFSTVLVVASIVAMRFL